MKSVVLSAFIFIFSSASAFAQDWRQIVPLISDCEDIKRILKIDKCEAITFVETSDYNLMISFTKNDCKGRYKVNADCWNVPIGTVQLVIIILLKGFALKDYEADLSNYEIKSVPDLPDYLRYINKEKGVELSVADKLAVQSVKLFPSEVNVKKFKCRRN